LTRTLELEEATAAAIAPYGALLGAGLTASRATKFYDDAVELYETPPVTSVGSHSPCRRPYGGSTSQARQLRGLGPLISLVVSLACIRLTQRVLRLQAAQSGLS